jgi:hypothetical protein
VKNFRVGKRLKKKWVKNFRIILKIKFKKILTKIFLTLKRTPKQVLMQAN